MLSCQMLAQHLYGLNNNFNYAVVSESHFLHSCDSLTTYYWFYSNRCKPIYNTQSRAD